jgi:hypothetical protein
MGQIAVTGKAESFSEDKYMTIRERAERFAQKLGAQPDQAAAILEEALREELKDVASTLSASATHKEKMYRELGLNGADQARPYHDIAEAVRRRSEL